MMNNNNGDVTMMKNKFDKNEDVMMNDNGMIENHWSGFSASIPGSGHIRRGIPCQDASAVMTAPRAAAIVCDGRGSAKLSHFGAQGAVDAFRFQMSVLEPFLVNILDEEEEKPEQWIKFCRIMYRTLMQVKYDLAEKHGEKDEKEFDCTVAFAIAGKKYIGCFQVGDGSIVARQNGICQTVFPPEKGEYANQTHFLRPGGEEKMKFQHCLLNAECNSGIAITSDGPEHLMFQLADMKPGKIFDMLLDDLAKEELCKQDLMDYLTRREWDNDPRGTDDRSLAVLTFINAEHAFIPVEAEHNEFNDVTKVPGDSTEEVVSETSASEEPADTETKSFAEPYVKPSEEPIEEVVVPVEKPCEEVVRSKKKPLSYLTPVFMSGLAITVLAETSCLMEKEQTIVRQKQQIESLSNQLAVEKAKQKPTPAPEVKAAPIKKVEVKTPQDKSSASTATGIIAAEKETSTNPAKSADVTAVGADRDVQ